MKRRDFLYAAGASAALITARKAGAFPAPAPRVVQQRAASDPRFDAVADLITRKMEELRIPGVAFGVLKDGQLQLRGFGVTNTEDPQPVTQDTVFSLASISKTVAGTAVMRLVEQGRLELDAPVQKYIPDFRVRDEAAARAITIRHLLTHSPGFEGQLTGGDRGLASLEFFVQTVIPPLEMLAPPGAVWSYNNAGYTVLGRVIEVASGRDIHAALRELVFAPLELTRSFTRLGDVVTHRFAQGHRTAGDRVEVNRPYALSSSVTAGGVAMSVADLLSYAQFHLGEATGARAGVLSRASLEAMRTPQLRKAPSEDAIGLSWQLRPVGGVMTASHGGTAGAGHRLLVELVPQRRLAFAILTNHADGWRLVEPVEREVLKRYENLELASGQPIVHRGISEDMTSHVKPLLAQPELQEYAGTYNRAPSGASTVRVEGGTLMVGQTRLAFYGKDVAYATGGGGVYVGQPYEFIRDSGGRVAWMRINGRIAHRS